MIKSKIKNAIAAVANTIDPIGKFKDDAIIISSP